MPVCASACRCVPVCASVYLLRLARGHVAAHDKSLVESEKAEDSLISMVTAVDCECCRSKQQNAPNTVVLQQSFDEGAQCAQLANELFGFEWNFVPEGAKHARDDDVDGLQQHVVDAKRAEVSRVKLHEM